VAEFTLRASRNGKERRPVEADTREQAEIIAKAWWDMLWENIRINDVPWTPPCE